MADNTLYSLLTSGVQLDGAALKNFSKIITQTSDNMADLAKTASDLANQYQVFIQQIALDNQQTSTSFSNLNRSATQLATVYALLHDKMAKLLTQQAPPTTKSLAVATVAHPKDSGTASVDPNSLAANIKQSQTELNQGLKGIYNKFNTASHGMFGKVLGKIIVGVDFLEKVVAQVKKLVDLVNNLKAIWNGLSGLIKGFKGCGGKSNSEEDSEQGSEKDSNKSTEENVKESEQNEAPNTESATAESEVPAEEPNGGLFDLAKGKLKKLTGKASKYVKDFKARRAAKRATSEEPAKTAEEAPKDAEVAHTEELTKAPVEENSGNLLSEVPKDVTPVVDTADSTLAGVTEGALGEGITATVEWGALLASLPELLAAAAVGGMSYGLYKLYKHSKAAPYATHNAAQSLQHLQQHSLAVPQHALLSANSPIFNQSNQIHIQCVSDPYKIADTVTSSIDKQTSPQARLLNQYATGVR